MLLSSIARPRFNKYLLHSRLIKPKFRGLFFKRIWINPLTAAVRWQALALLPVFILYFLICAWMFFTWAKPEAEGSTRIRFGADSATYYAIGDAIDQSENATPLLSLSANLLGPIVLVLFVKDAIWIAIFNLSLFVITLYAASTIRGIRFYVFAILLMIDAETASALITVNKEIFALFGVILFAKYVEMKKKSALLLVIILISSILARWEQVVIIGLFFLFERSKLFKERRVWALLSLIGAITIAYPAVAHQVDMTSFEVYAEGGNTMVLFNKVQANFGYFLVVIPKTLMNLLGNVATPWYWFTTWPTMDRSDIQNVFLIRLHEFAMAGVLLVACLRRRLQLQAPIIFFIAIYLVVTSSNLFVQSRYDYPVYVLLCLEIARSAPMEKINECYQAV